MTHVCENDMTIHRIYKRVNPCLFSDNEEVILVF